MERDGVLAPGMSKFLNESLMVRGDEYYIAVCNNSGLLAVYNKEKIYLLAQLSVISPFHYKQRSNHNIEHAIE